MADRRRINGPANGTSIPLFSSSETEAQKVQRTRKPNQLRRIYLETGVTPNASGSAYLELENPHGCSRWINAVLPSLKLSCAVHGPKPLPRNATFSPNLQLTASVKFAPFATSQRRGYVRDITEKDIGTHLETALNGVIIPERWPKSAIDVVITILEAEDDNGCDTRPETQGGVEGVGGLNVLSGCITVASAALLDARIDCLDLVTGGVAATVSNADGRAIRILDPSSLEESCLSSICVVGYMPTRDEMTLVWAKGDIRSEKDEHILGFSSLLDSAVNAARGAHVVLRQVATELAQAGTKRVTNDGSEINKKAVS